MLKVQLLNEKYYNLLKIKEITFVSIIKLYLLINEIRNYLI